MKRITMTLMMTFMAFFVSAACVFAETESENGIDPYDITKWNIHLDKTTYEFNYMEEAGFYEPAYHIREFGDDAELLDHLKYNAPSTNNNWISYESDSCVKWDVPGADYYYQNSYDDEGNGYNGYYPGKHTLKLTGIEPYHGTVEIPFTVVGFKVYSDNLFFAVDDCTYNGKAKTPKGGFDINLDEDTVAGISKGKDYSNATYKYKNNKKIGVATAYVTIKFKGNFSGTATKKTTFKICPKRTTFTSVKGYKKSVKVKWKKRKDITGYRVQIYKYSNDKMIDSYTFKNKKRNSLNITGLKRHSKYYVTVETYKKVKGKKIYSNSWGYKAVRTH